MPDDKKQTDKKIMKVQTCEYFNHMLNPHIHECRNAVNVSKRCGYDVHDIKDCPIKGKIVEMDVRPSKGLNNPSSIVESEKSKLDKPTLPPGPDLEAKAKASGVAKSDKSEKAEVSRQPSDAGKTTNDNKTPKIIQDPPTVPQAEKPTNKTKNLPDFVPDNKAGEIFDATNLEDIKDHAKIFGYRYSYESSGWIKKDLPMDSATGCITDGPLKKEYNRGIKKLAKLGIGKLKGDKEGVK